MSAPSVSDFLERRVKIEGIGDRGSAASRGIGDHVQQQAVCRGVLVDVVEKVEGVQNDLARAKR